MRRGLAGSLWGTARALAPWAAALLVACASADEDGAGRTGFVPGVWQAGGQTGSLMPLCGLTPGALMHGVPASAEGLVLEPSACPDRELLAALAVRDASGQEVGFTVRELADGTLLVTFAGGFAPGSYTIELAAPERNDDDAGIDGNEPPLAVDAGIERAPIVQHVEIEERAPLPTRFGEVVRTGGQCGAVLELTPTAEVVPYLGVVSVDLQLDHGAALELVPAGTLQLVNGTARINLLEHGLDELAEGSHELRVTTKIAGLSMPLETFLLTVQIPCGYGEYVDYGPSGGSESSGCSASLTPQRLPTPLSPAMFAVLYALRKRRRRPHA